MTEDGPSEQIELSDVSTPKSATTNHYLNDLDPLVKIAAYIALALIALAPVLVALKFSGQGWTATGDAATIGLRTMDTWGPNAPLVGQPTTGENASGVLSYHPGPLQNWVLSPAVRLLGLQTGLLVGTAIVVGASLATIVWLSFRRAGIRVAGLSVAMLSLLVWALGSFRLVDPMNSEFPTFPLLACMFTMWCILVGDLKVAPAFAFFSALAMQPHVSGFATLTPLLLIALVRVVQLIVTRPELRRETLPWLACGVLVLITCWIPPLLQELSGPSNFTALVETSIKASGPTLGALFLVERILASVTPMPLWAHRGRDLEFMKEQGAGQLILGALIAGGTGSVALARRFFSRRPAPSQLYLISVALLLSAVTAWAGAPVTSGFRSDGFRWLWVTSWMIWFVLLWSAGSFVLERLKLVVKEKYVAGFVVACSIGICVLGVVNSNLALSRDNTYQEPTRYLSRELIAALPAGNYYFTFGGGSDAGLTVGPGILAAAEDAGWKATVPDNQFGRAFGASRTGRHEADSGRISVLQGNPELATGERIIASTKLFPTSAKPVQMTVTLQR